MNVVNKSFTFKYNQLRTELLYVFTLKSHYSFWNFHMLFKCTSLYDNYILSNNNGYGKGTWMIYYKKKKEKRKRYSTRFATPDVSRETEAFILPNRNEVVTEYLRYKTDFYSSVCERFVSSTLHRKTWYATLKSTPVKSAKRNTI